ncbi:MAG: DUF4912 domain-containing protein, partial [Candidatus Omnitrophica bacterium]|nr:DUF4912 domain-containing protein [Candidatus Omnitrophota bacterium]
MNRQKLRKTKKDKLILLARKSNIRGAHLMDKERLIDVLMRLNMKKTRSKKISRARAQRIISQIRTLPQHRLKERVLPVQPVGQQRVEEAKYYLGPWPEYKSPEEFRFPAGYGDNRIVIMVRDPWWVFAYWEITSEK